MIAGAAAFLFAVGSGVYAEEEVTLEGTATCAKCDLGTEKKCTNVLQAGEELYYLDGEAGPKWHKHICKSSKEVKVTGKIEEADGKKTLVASSIEIVE